MATDKLARIRDNQRRSRARRREYQQELEAKVRKCEASGIETSVKIQAAARKVLEENVKLKMLLKTKGVPDAEVNAFLAAPTEQQPPPVDALGELLRDGKRSCEQPSGIENSSDHQLSCMPTLRNYGTGADHFERARSECNSHLSSSQQSHAMISVDPNTTFQNRAPETASGIQLSKAAGLSEVSFPTAAEACCKKPAADEHTAVNAPSNQSDPDYLSCIDAANIIRSMRSDVGQELEAELGCTEPGTECKVRNTIVFDVMDKYSRGDDLHR